VPHQPIPKTHLKVTDRPLTERENVHTCKWKKFPEVTNQEEKQKERRKKRDGSTTAELKEPLSAGRGVPTLRGHGVSGGAGWVALGSTLTWRSH